MDDSDDKLDQAKPAVIFTRRDWLLNFGGAVLLSGFRGAPGEFPQEPETAARSLPSGLYSPSLDHLSHALASEGPFFPVPSGARTEYVRPRSGPFVPQAFSAEQFLFLRRLAEII